MKRHFADLKSRLGSISMSTVLIVVLMSCGVCACGKSEPKPPPKVKDTVFGGLVDQKERARLETEKAMEANKQKLEEAMKKQDEDTKP